MVDFYPYYFFRLQPGEKLWRIGGVDKSDVVFVRALSAHEARARFQATIIDNRFVCSEKIILRDIRRVKGGKNVK